RKCRFHQSVTVVDSQPDSRLDLSFYAIKLGEFPVRGRRVVVKGIIDACVPEQIVQDPRHAVPFEVVGRRTCYKAKRRQWARNKT
ncbi:hypothetical protein SB764_39925, partial [Paraburkholderia sp. SIMBA_027]